MNILRWIISAPISIVLLGLLCTVIEWLLSWFFSWVLRIGHFTMVWNTRYDNPPIFDWEYKLKDLKILPSDFSLDGKINPQKSDAMYFDWLDKNAVIDAIEK
jgi:hypothetical protein